MKLGKTKARFAASSARDSPSSPMCKITRFLTSAKKFAIPEVLFPSLNQLADFGVARPLGGGDVVPS
jgi:hypothetical protein